MTEFDQRVVSTFTSQFVPLENPFDDDAVFDASKMTDSVGDVVCFVLYTLAISRMHMISLLLSYAECNKL